MRKSPRTVLAASIAVLVLAGGAGCAVPAAELPLDDMTIATVATADPAASVTLGLAAGSGLQNGLHLSVSLAGGAPLDIMLDTGSTGIVIAQQFLGGDYTDTGESFSGFTYSSSGNSYSGEWVTAPVQLNSSDGSTVAQTIPIRMRMVTQECLSGQPCVTDESAISVQMMGIGFDRVDPHGTTVDPSVNPFLNVVGMQSGGPMTPGYVITTSQVTLGITDADTAGFSFIPLQRLPAAQGDDWQAPTTCVSVPSAGVAPQCGPLLVDTGLAYAIVEVPAGVDPPQQQGTGAASKRQVLDPGQQVVITSPDLQDQAIYTFTVGDDSTGAPPQVAWGHGVASHGGQAFMNTSRSALSQFDYAYDAGGGRLGLRFHATS